MVIFRIFQQITLISGDIFRLNIPGKRLRAQQNAKNYKIEE